MKYGDQIPVVTLIAELHIKGLIVFLSLACSSDMVRMSLPQPSMSERQQESGTASLGLEKVVLVQSLYSWAPQQFI